MTNIGTDSLCAWATAVTMLVAPPPAETKHTARFFRHARIAERHVAGAAFMLRIDEFHMRPFGDGIADRKRSVRQDAEDILHAS